MGDKKKRFKVTLVFTLKDTIEVEANSENEAEHLALQECEVPINAEHYETKFKQLD